MVNPEYPERGGSVPVGYSFSPEGRALWLWREGATGSSSGGRVGGVIPLPAGADAFLGPQTNLIVFFAFFAPAMLSMLVAAVVPVNSALLSSVPASLRGFSMALAVVAIHLGALALARARSARCPSARPRLPLPGGLPPFRAARTHTHTHSHPSVKYVPHRTVCARRR